MGRRHHPRLIKEIIRQFSRSRRGLLRYFV
jgi:hypothetical protein